MSRHHRASHSLLAITALGLGYAVPLCAQQTAPPLVVGSCSQVGPRKLQVSLTFLNCGAGFDRDYAAFIHYDRSATGERLYSDPEPGLRPQVAALTTSAWGPNEEATVEFGAVTAPAALRGTVYVKAGLWDPEGGGRLPLSGADGTGRVTIGTIETDAEGCRFSRSAPARLEAAETLGARPRAFVKQMPQEPAARLGEVDLQDWTVEPIGDGAAALSRTREELCWSEASLKVEYRGTGRPSGFVLKPQTPLPIGPDADVAYLWLLGRAYGWSETRTDEEPLLAHWLQIADSQGEVHQLRFPAAIAYPYWYVARARIPADWPRPLTCTGLGFSGCSNTRPRSLLLDALVFSKETLAPKLATSVDLTDAPFPTSPDGLLPDPPGGEFANEVKAAGDGWELRYVSDDEQIIYVYRPLAGTFDDIEVSHTGPDGVQQRFRPAAEGGPVVELGGPRLLPGAPGLACTLLATEADADKVVTRWRCAANGEAAEYTQKLSIRGRSLLVELAADTPGLVGIAAGHYDGPEPGRFIYFPYFTWGVWDYGRDGGVLCTDHLFASCFPDWYRSQASSLSFGSALSHRPEALTAESVTYAPGVEYQRCSNGARSLLSERYIVTVSDDVLNVLPNIPHRPSPNRDKLAGMCHYTGGMASRLEDQLDSWREMHAYGISDVYIRHFDGMWSDVPQGPQEWTLTEHAAPAAGDAKMRRYLDELRAMGFLPVLYTNYTDLQPVAAEFDWDNVAQLPDGNISHFCWPGSYPLKPLRAVELEAKYAPRIAKRFGTQGSFCDVHTAVAPWHKLDHNSRLPGAGQFGTTYRCYAKLLANERETYGAVYSEGSSHWLYAGIADGSDGQIRSPNPHREPFLVDFDLRKIHPLEMDAGMSWISRYVETPEARQELGGAEAAQDRYTAATVAFGHQGTFTSARFRGYSTDIKTYYMVGALQRQYAMRKPETILYHNPATSAMETVSQALRSGAYRDGQVQVVYDSGLRLWANGSLTQDWTIEAGGKAYKLPPSGYVGLGPGVLVTSHATPAGRADYATGEGMRFADARGARQELGEFDTDGAALLRQAEDGGWDLWPLGDMTELEIRAADLGLGKAAKLTPQDQSGATGAPQEAPVQDGWLVLPVGDGTFRWRVD